MHRSHIIILTLSIAGSHCQDSSLDKDRLHEQRNLSVNEPEKTDGNASAAKPSEEKITPPQKVIGAYLQCFTQTYDAATNDFAISCGVHRSDQSQPDTLGLWEAQIVAPMKDEKLRALDPEKGWFMYHAGASKIPDDLGKRLSISYRGKFDAIADILVTTSDQAIDIPLLIPTPPSDVPLVCPSGYSLVLADADYASASFCLMRYEASNDGTNRPQSKPEDHWGALAPNQVNATCGLLGPRYQQMTNAQWMTVASKIASLPENWTGKKVGEGLLFTGHTDNDPPLTCAPPRKGDLVYVENSCTPTETGDSPEQNRKHVLANGEVFWDLSGNSYENVDYKNSEDKPGATTLWYEYPALKGTTLTPLSHLIPTQAVKSYWSDTWNSAQGIGQFWPGQNGSGGIMSRGGDLTDGLRGGLFAGSLTGEPTTDPTNTNSSFRCVYRP